MIFSYLMSGSCPLLYSLPRWSLAASSQFFISDFSPAVQILISNCLLDISPRMFSRYIKRELMKFSLSPAPLCIHCLSCQWRYLHSHPQWQPGSNFSVLPYFHSPVVLTLYPLLYLTPFHLYCTISVQALIICHLNYFRCLLTTLADFLINLPCCCQFFKSWRDF